MRANHQPGRFPRHLVLVIATLVAAVMAMPALAGPSGAWERISTPAGAGAAAAYAGSTNQFYVFGGDGTGILHATTADAPPSEWLNVATDGTPPAVRSGGAMVYDPTGDRLLLFGGRDPESGAAFGDLWQLSLAGTPTWSELATGGDAPSPRADAGVCFDDSRGILVVFGGADESGVLFDSDLYQVDLRQANPAWSRWSPVGDTPSPRSNLVLCDVPALDGLVVFGGNDGSGDLADAYRLSYGSHVWTAIPGAGDLPPPVSGALGVYDPDDGVMLVWGGGAGDGEVRSLVPATGLWTIEPNTSWQAGPAGHTQPLGAWTGGGQLLVLDGDDGPRLFEFHYLPPGGSYWQDWRAPGSPGDIRSGCTFVYDPQDDVALLCDGHNQYEEPVQSTWSYALGGQKGWTNTFFLGLCGNDTPALTRHVAVWDSKRHRMLVFGGLDAAYNRQNAVYAMDYQAGGWNCWSPLTTAGTPPTGRYGTAAIYDPVGDRMLVFGGSDTSGYPRDDLWQLSLSGTPTWTQVNATGGPGAREDHTAIYDSAHRRMVVFGGVNSFGGHPGDEAWALNLPSLTWTLLQPTGPTPPIHAQHTSVYDSRRGRMLVFGGQVAWNADERDVWELNLASNPPAWSLLTPTHSAQWLPMKRSLHAAVYDSTGDRMLVYGGLVPPIGPIGNAWPIGDLWSLQFDGSGGAAAVDNPSTSVAFAVAAPSPNPSGGLTHLMYALPRAARVRATIYDVAGRRVAELVDGDVAAGEHELQWTGRDGAGRPAAPGLYFFRLESGGQAVTRKVLLVR